jgi:hypothetical protein
MLCVISRLQAIGRKAYRREASIIEYKGLNHSRRRRGSAYPLAYLVRIQRNLDSARCPFSGIFRALKVPVPGDALGEESSGAFFIWPYAAHSMPVAARGKRGRT